MNTHLRPRLDYNSEELEYLHSPPTYSLWEKIVYYIKFYNSKNIVDIGCGTGAVNQFLTGYQYNYYGIDYSKNLIEDANNKWSSSNIKFEHGDWNTSSTIVNCDCMLLLGVLPYGIQTYGYTDYLDPWDMYTKLVKKYNPTQIIIRETCKIQNGVELDIDTVDLTPFLNIATNIDYINVDTILGNKVLINVTRERT